MKAMSFGHLPYTEIVERYGIDTSVFYEYLSNYNDDMRKEAGDDMLCNIKAEGMGAIADIMVIVELIKDDFVVSILHTDVFNDETCRKIVDIYGRMVKKIIKH